MSLELSKLRDVIEFAKAQASNAEDEFDTISNSYWDRIGAALASADSEDRLALWEDIITQANKALSQYRDPAHGWRIKILTGDSDEVIFRLRYEE